MKSAEIFWEACRIADALIDIAAHMEQINNAESEPSSLQAGHVDELEMMNRT
jgi:hypothetical protein